MDLAIKPSLAGYTFRPDTFDVRSQSGGLGPNGAVQKARDPDDAYLALVDRRAEVAHRKLQGGHPQQAINLLRQAHSTASTYDAPSPKGETPLVVRLASASLRLQLCTALSQIGRHQQAMEEALNSKAELDSVWYLLTDAVEEVEALNAQGLFLQLDEALRTHLQSPPRWLQRMLETAIQARLCISLEAEYTLPDEEFQAALDASMDLSTGVPSSLVPLDAENTAEQQEEVLIGMPLPRLSLGQEVAQMHREALLLSRNLLPKGHATRVETEKTIREAQSRWRNYIDKMASPSPIHNSMSKSMSDSMLCFTTSASSGAGWSPSAASSPILPIREAPDELPPLSKMPKVNRARMAKPSFFANQAAATSAAFLHASSFSKDSWDSGITGSTFAESGRAPSMEFFSDTQSMAASLSGDSRISMTGSNPMTHAEWVRTAPPGDVMYRSFPSNFAQSMGQTRSISPCVSPTSKKGRKILKQMTTPKDMNSTSNVTVQEPEDKDPFKAWKKSAATDSRRMTPFQKKLQSYEGLNELQTDMRREKRRFRFWMNDLEATYGEEHLTEDRVLFCEHGVNVSKMGHKRKDAAKVLSVQATEAGQKQEEAFKEYFKHYNMTMPKEGLTMKSLLKLMQSSFDRTPAEVQRKKEEAARKKRQEAEEAEKKRQDLAKGLALSKR
eukprot:TRINITY_DN76649_c0_g1_i1.p1 TRINITY_DN76649_c0_g1~~TRINITY_DN76649_c0_g1_i1.p1  ORF type:complete len:670 (+),score=143.70 TRINITY_DN76649_c0_g1_i1:75-2084(+)